MYGHVWLGQYKNDEFTAFVKKEWQKGLAKYHDNVLELATDLCRRKRELPPTLPKFIEICNSYQQNAVEMPDDLPLNTNSPIAKANLFKIKQILNMKTNEGERRADFN